MLVKYILIIYFYVFKIIDNRSYTHKKGPENIGNKREVTKYLNKSIAVYIFKRNNNWIQIISVEHVAVLIVLMFRYRCQKCFFLKIFLL